MNSTLCTTRTKLIWKRIFGSSARERGSSYLVQSRANSSESKPEERQRLPEHDQLKAGPYQKVGNIIIIELNHHLWQQPWEVSRALRELNFEYRGQVTVHPDIPEVRERLFHCRNLVNIDIMPIDEMKRLLCIPAHITFNDLLSQIPETWGDHPPATFEYTVAVKKFAQYRKERIRDIMHRDAMELRLLRLRRERNVLKSGGSTL